MEDNQVIINVIDREGKEHSIEAPLDMNLNLMEVLKIYELPVEGRCGGMAMCATCQVYIESDHSLSEPTDGELDMLDEAFFVKDNSRLGCQIKITEDLHNLIVRLAPEGN